MDFVALIVFLIALATARFINWAIYSWAWNNRSFGPWSAPPAATSKSAKTKAASAKAKRSTLDHVPVIGWYLLRREASEHGRGYWVRPLLIELCFPILLTMYYRFVVTGGMLPNWAQPLPPNMVTELTWLFVAHFFLFTLMTIATFIDFDEQSIPDFVTVPGTIIGLVGAAFAPHWLPMHTLVTPPVELNASLPRAWPASFNTTTGLAYGLLILAVWGFALLDRRWITRRGWGKAVEYFFARMFRVRQLWMSLTLVTIGLMTFVSLVFFVFPARWEYLLSSLLGLAFAGGVTWGVRIAASTGLGVEALGFGDVTLMAMIGTYIGWQPSLIVFFVAPFTAILFVALRAIITGETATPYGPYLCAGVIVVLVFWDALWTKWAGKFFSLGLTIVGIIAACVAIMGVMLWIWRLIKESLGLGGR